MREEIEPGIGDIPEKGIYGISPAIDGDLLEVDYVAPQKGGGITRRQFVAGASAAGGLLVLAGCVRATETPPVATRTPEEVGLPHTPTLEIKTPTPTEKPIPPTPTVVQREIGTIPRELGGAESEIFSVSYNDEAQQGVLNRFPDGGQWFLLAVYPDLPGVEEKVDFANEAVGYDGMFFLTAVLALEDHPNAHPFYQKEPEEEFPNGVLLYIENGEIVARVDPFAHLQEGEVSVRFDPEKGIYEFLDEAGNVTRTKIIFMVPEPSPTPEPTATFTKEPTPTYTPRPPEPTATPTPEIIPSNEICAVGELAGRCYQRTSTRTGDLEDGHVLPDGSVMYHPMDPDFQLSGRWRMAGRIGRIDTDQNIVYLKGRGEDIISVRLMFNDPLFYARMQVASPSPGPWREVFPEIKPRLIKDVQVGDYLYFAIDDVWAFETAGSKTYEEMYQSVIKAQAKYGPLSGYRIEIIQ